MKIPCSAGILTLNSAKTLPRCLEHLKDFAEIIICDGNSTDNTVQIAQSYGAKVIKQYDSNEPNLRCMKDKANVRNRNMDAATQDWYVFIDADDSLLSETVEEIRSIVTNPHPEHLIYRMPTRIFVDGIFKYASVYPAYQMRLFNRKTSARFKGAVHDHIIFDKQKYTVGTMQSYYDFHISSDRVRNYWKYQKDYTRLELETAHFSSIPSFLYWGIYRRLRIIAGFLLYRIPKLYLAHGFKHSMPVKYEFLTLWQHVYLLYLLITRAPKLIHA
ncbi:MAG: glycosyltransferase family 2 protein [bacterium]|nr:glycosyltransferase family 2 protein [bacterium]